MRIVGHTDADGDPEANRRLSLARAEVVRDHLVAAHGLDPARFVVEDAPVASNGTRAGRRTGTGPDAPAA